MSHARTTPADISDESINRNPAFTKPHPSRKGIAITIAAGRWCKLCGWQFETALDKCPSCGSQSYRDFEENELLSVGTKGQTAHLRRKVLYCWNAKVDPVSDDVLKHLLEVELVPVVDLSFGEWHLEERCTQCGAAYGYSEGRAATAEEIQKAKNGKISLRSPKSKLMGTGGAP